jgi:hypothetical protein
LAQIPNWRSLVKTSLTLQSCPLFQINRRPKVTDLGDFTKGNRHRGFFGRLLILKEGIRLQLQRRFYQTAINWKCTLSLFLPRNCVRACWFTRFIIQAVWKFFVVIKWPHLLCCNVDPKVRTESLQVAELFLSLSECMHNYRIRYFLFRVFYFIF